jgi:hypothetical protein
MTPAEQIELLLPWANDHDDALTLGVVRECLRRFLRSFSGSRLRVTGHRGLDLVHDASHAELQATRRKVMRLLESAFWFSVDAPRDRRGHESLDWDDVRLPLSLPSIRFAAARRAKGYVKRSQLGRKDHRQLLAGGAYEILIEASRLRDLVPFLVLHLLAMPGAIGVARCSAPAPNDWTQRCGRLFIIATGRKGRPREYCSRECTDRQSKGGSVLEPKHESKPAVKRAVEKMLRRYRRNR